MFSLPTPGRTFVLRDGVAIVDNAAARLYNTSTDVINLPVGTIGLYRETANSSNPTSTTGNTTLPLEVIFRMDKTQIKSPLDVRELERSGKINAWNKACFRVTIMGAKEPVNNLHLVDLTSLTPEDEFSYLIISRVTGSTVDVYNSVRNHPSKQTDYVTPDFALAGITAAQAKRDLLIQNLVYKYNDSNYPGAGLGVAFAIGTTGGAGGGATVTVTAAAALAIGSVITIGYKLNGEPETLQITIGVKNALTALAVTNGADYIIPYNLPGSTNVSGVTVAGSAGATVRAESIVFIALNDQEPYYSYRHAYNTKLYIGLTTGFAGISGVTNTEVTSPEPGEGLQTQSFLAAIRDEYNTYAPGAGQRYAPNHIHYPTELVASGWYDQVRIEWCDNGTSNSSHVSQHHHSLTILVPNYTEGEDVNTFWTGTENAQLTDLRTALAAYITANGLTPIVEYTA